jgi:hypothetical protein
MAKYVSLLPLQARVQLVPHYLIVFSLYTDSFCTGVDLDDTLVSSCRSKAAALCRAHLLHFFTADVLEVDVLAAAEAFAGQGHHVVIAV